MSKKDQLSNNINEEYLTIFLKIIDVAKRLEICQECEFYIKTARICGKCKCFMPLKARFRKSTCPIGKW